MLKKHNHLKDFKTEIGKYINKRVNESEINSNLKKDLEDEILAI